MARYLVVAHQTATSPLLLERAQEIFRDDPRAEFVLLVPEAPVSHALVWDGVETREFASRRATEAAEAFRSQGLPLVRAETGCSSPTLAIADEFRKAPDGYDAIVLSTLHSGRSRWLRTDHPRRLIARHGVPVLHIAEGADAAWESTAPLRRELARGRRPAPRQPVTVPPSFLEQSRWFFGVGLGLVALHALLMTNLAVSTDTRFVAAELLVLGVFGAMLLVGWTTRRPSRPPGDDERAKRLLRQE